MKPSFLKPAALALAIALSACSSAPTTTSMLDQARGDYMAAQGNPAVSQYAAVELRQATAALDRANEAAARHESIAEVDKLAYVAKQRVATAQEVAKQKSAEAAVADAARQRDQIRLEARTMEADNAKRSAEQAKAEADAARAAAESQAAATRDAQAQADALAAQLADLKAKQTDRGIVMTMGDVLFNVDQSNLTAGGMQVLQKLADVMRQHPDRTVMVEGFTDSTGTAEHNLVLSQRRAESVRNALMNMGIEGTRISTRGYGEEYPVASNANSADRQLNRRVEIVLSDAGRTVNARH
ncbi:OmpA family protein [Pseudoduganella ginsengisoli]|uniref:OmpA family protein n=1 Tax=Pseudoduganella ginsengisoli TaxID=1462440 RepID=A0A6L6Q069_9BURK|nr:OmpA family protein [Pseudoduganella ginsengisoli]MTW03283.1 OmpA family protein [Pseudoduganella ginsengisoli]